jgi:capsular exopolysaccharide synthesis family protein
MLQTSNLHGPRIEPNFRNPANHSMQIGGEFGLGDLADVLMRRAQIALGAAGVLFLIGLGVIVLMPPKYVATTTLMINPGTEQVVSNEQALSRVQPSPALVESEMRIINSPAVLRRLVVDLDLTRDPEWAAGGAWLAKPKGAPTESEIDRTAKSLGEAITVRREDLSFVVDVSVASRNAEKASRVANALIATYLRYGAEARTDITQRAGHWLSERLNELREDVLKKEAQQEAFRAQSGLLGASGSTLTEQQITGVQTSVLEARADLAEKEARQRAFNELRARGGSVDSMAGVLNSEVIRELRTREADLARQQAELRQKYGPLHPAIETNRVELQQIRDQISGEVSRIAQNVGNEVAIARARLATLEGRLGSVRTELSSNNESQVRLNELEREASGARAVYESFLQRLHQVTQQGDINNDVRVVSLARPPTEPAGPGKAMRVVLLLAGVILLAVIIAILLEAADDTLHDARSVSRRIGRPALTSIPQVRKQALDLLHSFKIKPTRYLLDQPYSTFAEAIRVLRIAMLYHDERDAPRAVAITSALPNEGKTTCALSLARQNAISGQKTIIVDCDLRRRSLNDALELKPEVGLLEVLSNGADCRDAIVLDELSGLHVLPIAPWVLMPHDVFGLDSMKTLLVELQTDYELVVLDCAPVLAVAEVRTVTRLADAVVVVCRANKTSSAAVAATVEQIEQTGGRVIGVALNDVVVDAPRRYTSVDSLCFRHVADYYRGV